MRFIDFLKDNYSLFIFNFSYLIFSILIILISPLNILFSNIVSYLILINLTFLSIYILFNYVRKNHFLKQLNTYIQSKELNNFSLFTINHEEQQYLNLIKSYRESTQNIIKKSNDKFEKDTDLINLWVHDIKMPISVLKLIIQRNQNLEYEQILDSIDDEVTRIDNYVEKILYLSRLDSFHKDLLIQEIDLEDTIKQIIKKYSKYFISNKIRLKIQDINTTILSDQKWLLFIFDQVISNSLKYTKQEDSIEIYGKKINQEFKLTIKDSGCGIKKEDLNRVFEKGFTGNNGRKNAKSTGLGLYLTKKLCINLDHTIEISSSYNEFTSISITFKNYIDNYNSKNNII